MNRTRTKALALILATWPTLAREAGGASMIADEIEDGGYEGSAREMAMAWRDLQIWLTADYAAQGFTAPGGAGHTAASALELGRAL